MIRSPRTITLVWLGLSACAPPRLAATDDESSESSGESETSGDGDGDPATGDGDGDPSTTGDGDGDPSTTGDGDGDPSTTGDGDGDGLPDPPTPVEPLPFDCPEGGELPWTGQLCGGSQPACLVEAAEIILANVNEPHPPLLVGPDCALHTGWTDTYAYNDGSGWVFDQDDGIYKHAMAVDGQGQAYAMSAGADGTYRWVEDSWELINNQLESVTPLFAHSRSDGNVYLAYGNDTDIYYARLEGDEWQEIQHHDSLFDEFYAPYVSPFGGLQYITCTDGEGPYWSAHEAPNEFFFPAVPGQETYNCPTFVNGEDPQQVFGVAHTMFVRMHESGQRDLYYARRNGPDDWTVIPIDIGTPDSATEDEDDPNLMVEERVEPRSAVVFGSTGHERLLWVRSHWDFSQELICDPDCKWVTLVDNSIHELRIGEIVDGQLVAQVVTEGFDVLRRPSVAIDQSGRIHALLEARNGKPNDGRDLVHMILAPPD